jgi:hypothetical protein
MQLDTAIAVAGVPFAVQVCLLAKLGWAPSVGWLGGYTLGAASGLAIRINGRRRLVFGYTWLEWAPLHAVDIRASNGRRTLLDIRDGMGAAALLDIRLGDRRRAHVGCAAR